MRSSLTLRPAEAMFVTTLHSNPYRAWEESIRAGLKPSMISATAPHCESDLTLNGVAVRVCKTVKNVCLVLSDALRTMMTIEARAAGQRMRQDDIWVRSCARPKDSVSKCSKDWRMLALCLNSIKEEAVTISATRT